MKMGLQSNHLHMQHYTALQGKGEAMIHWKYSEAVGFLPEFEVMYICTGIIPILSSHNYVLSKVRVNAASVA